jgi:hypothetical protein
MKTTNVGIRTLRGNVLVIVQTERRSSRWSPDNEKQELL